MSAFSREFPLNPDGSLGPVKIGSKVRPMIPLVRGDVKLLPGCGWDNKTILIEKELAEESKSLRILASMPAEISLAHFVETILNKRPIVLKVSLFPGMAMPGMGVPVPVEAAPVIDEVSITMPAIKRPEIDLNAEFVGREPDGAYRIKVTATLDLPPYIAQADKLDVRKRITLDSDVKVTPGAETPLENGKEIELTAPPNFAAKTGAASLTLTSRVSLAGLELRTVKKITLDVERKYLLNVHPASLGVTVKTPASLTAQVLEEMPDGRKLLVEDAAIAVSGGDGLVSLAPSEGKGRLSCKVTQPKIAEEKKTALTVSASAGRDRMPPQTVPVVLETVGGGRIEVVFDPPEKTSLSPFLKTDHVILRARVVPEKEGAIVPADISFELENPDGWLEGPREFGSTSQPPGNIAAPTADISTPQPKSDEEWKVAAFFGKVPAGSKDTQPPASEQVIVRATLKGQAIDERPVPIGLQSMPSIVADKQELAILANGKGQAIGWSLATSPNDVSLVVMRGGDEDWKFTVRSDSERVDAEEKDRQPGASSFRFTPKDNLQLPTVEAGKPRWEEVIEFSTQATSGNGLVIEGPKIAVILCYEGIFIDTLYACEETGRFVNVTPQGAIPYRVYSPTEKRSLSIDPEALSSGLLFPYATLVAMVWNGSALEQKDDLAIEAVDGPCPPSKAQTSHDEDPKAAALWEFVCFRMRDSGQHDSVLKVLPSPPDDSRKNLGKQHVLFFKQIPGNGEVAKGHVRFVAGGLEAERYRDFGCDVPVHLHFGNSRPKEDGLSVLEEAARCQHIIDECFPPEYRERLNADLESLPGKSAKDYRGVALGLCERTWESWSVEQKDFLYWESGWGSWFYWGAEKAKWAGDVSFMLLVGYATAELGPVNAYLASTAAGAWKDEALAFYEYYLEHGGGKLPHKCAYEFVSERLSTFLLSLTAGAVDMAILHGFDIKNPASYTRLAWLWIWKFEQRLAGDHGEGYIDAMVEAGKEVLSVPVMILLQDFVNNNANKKLTDLWNSKIKPEEKAATTSEKEEPTKEKKEKKEGGKPDKKTAEKDKKGTEPEKTTKEKGGKEKTPAERKVDQAIKDSSAKVNEADRNAFEKGRADGRKKVDDLNKAAEELRKNPSDSEARRKFGEAAEKVQMDKHAMHELNDQNKNKTDSTREQFNEFWKGKYEKVDRAVKQEIANELNKSLQPGDKPYTAKDIEIVAVTNTQPKSPKDDSVKSTYDRDVTYRDMRPPGKDIPSQTSERIYNEEFYKERHQGQLPTKTENGTQVVDHEKIKEFAHDCDQTVTDRFHKDAYGGGSVDIPPAVNAFYKGQPFKDVGATAQAMEYKVLEWYDKAGKAAERGDCAAAEGYKEEGMRQLTKQFKNQVEARVDKINEISGSRKAEVPGDLRAAVEVMDRVGTQQNGRIFTPADAEAALAHLGTSPQKVISQMSGVVESLQKSAPPGVKQAVEDHVRGLSPEAAAAYAMEQKLKALKTQLKQNRAQQ